MVATGHINWQIDYVQAGQQGDQGQADEGDTAAGHELLDALAFCLCVIKKQ